MQTNILLDQRGTISVSDERKKKGNEKEVVCVSRENEHSCESTNSSNEKSTSLTPLDTVIPNTHTPRAPPITGNVCKEMPLQPGHMTTLNTLSHSSQLDLNGSFSSPTPPFNHYVIYANPPRGNLNLEDKVPFGELGRITLGPKERPINPKD